MEITRGCVILQLILQRICHPPAYCVMVNQELKMVPNFFKGTPSLASRWYNLTKFLETFTSVFAALRIFTLLNHWRDGRNLEEICFYTIILCVCNLGLSALNSLHAYASEICIAEENGLRLMKFRITGFPTIRKFPGLREFLVYIVLGGIIPSLAFCSAIAPFFLDYHPIKLITFWLYSTLGLQLDWYLSTLLDLLSGILYGCTMLHGGENVMFLLLGCVSFCEAMENLSFQLFNRTIITKISLNMPSRKIKLRRNWRDEDITMVVVRRTTFTFHRCLKLYRVMQILIRTGNQTVSDFLQTLIIMGVLLAGCGGFTCIKLYHRLPLLIYTVVSFLLPLCLVVNFVLIWLAAVPGINGLRFRNHWKSKLGRKVSRLQLQTCSPIGYSFGFVVNCKNHTALSIANFILNLVATLILLRHH